MTVEAELSIDVEHLDGSAVLFVRGELEFGTVAPLRSTIMDLARDRVDSVVLDLSGVSFIDSTGLSLLVQAKQRLHAEGARLVLRAPTARVLRVLDITGLLGLFVIEPAGD